jgi:lipopolysaccharide export LptBFGC system permease protein LptF
LAWKLTWYLIKEVLSLTALILAAVSVIMFLFRLLGYADYIFISEDGLFSILMFILFLFPAIFKLTVPISLLLACTIVFTRMSNDRELEGWLSVGVSPLRLCWPPALVGGLVFLFSAASALYGEPYARQEWRKFKYLHARKSVETLLQSNLQENTFLADVFRTGRQEMSLYVEKLDESKTELSGVFLALGQEKEAYSSVLLAKGGTLQKTSDQGLSDYVLTLRNGRFFQPSERVEESSSQGFLDKSRLVPSVSPAIKYDKEAYRNPGGSGPLGPFVGPPKPPGFEKEVAIASPTSTPTSSSNPNSELSGELPPSEFPTQGARQWSVVDFVELRISLLALFSRQFDPSSLDEVDMRSLYPIEYVRELRKLRLSEEWGKNVRFVRDHTFFFEQMTVPLACLFLPFIGVCLGMRDPRRKPGMAYLGMGLIVFAFYASIMICQQLAVKFWMPPELSLVLPPIVLFLLTLLCVVWRAKYPPSVSFFEFLSLGIRRRES